MTRWDIINHLIKENNYKSYLEIGYYKGWSFDAVKCQWKTAVDPNPCKTPDQEAWKYGKGSIDLGDGRTVFATSSEGLIVKLTSDDFFSKIEEDATWDIIFIDGLHESSQVYKDIQNSIKHLAMGGTIVMHDCNPPLYEHTTTGVDGCWTGDTYKAFLRYREKVPKHTVYCIDTDWGCGVIKPFNGMYIQESYKFGRGIESWEYFDENRKDLLNLITIEEFINKTK